MLGWIPKSTDATVASVRYRCLQPIAELRRRGFPVEIFSRGRLDRYSAVLFSKVYDDASFELAFQLKLRGKRVIFDICDNHFYNPYCLQSLELARRQLLRILKLADLVVASTEALADILVEEAALPVRPAVIGDAVEEELLSDGGPESGGWLRGIARRLGLPEKNEEGRRRVLWFGVHGGKNAPFGMLDILNQKGRLAELSRSIPLQLIVVSNSRQKFRKHIRPLPFATRYLEWRKVRLGEVLRSCDVNIIPISHNPFTFCKSNNRLALALYAGLPTVADEIPSYRDLARFCILNDWERGLRQCLENPAAARVQAAAARAYISGRYTIRQIGDQWFGALSPFL